MLCIENAGTGAITPPPAGRCPQSVARRPPTHLPARARTRTPARASMYATASAAPLIMLPAALLVRPHKRRCMLQHRPRTSAGAPAPRPPPAARRPPVDQPNFPARRSYSSSGSGWLTASVPAAACLRPDLPPPCTQGPARTRPRRRPRAISGPRERAAGRRLAL